MAAHHRVCVNQMMRTIASLVLSCVVMTASWAFQVTPTTYHRHPSTTVLLATTTRRQVMQQWASAVGAVAWLQPAHALDMDSFVNSELDSDTKNCDPKKDPKCKPKLSEDEALCKYGQSGDARAAACKRFRAAGGTVPSAASQGKSLGGAYAI